MMQQPNDPLFDAIRSPAPDPATADRLQLFGQLVGSWDLDVLDYDADGNATARAGEWHFAWALAGRAVIDVWICPRRSADGRSPGEHGMSVRFYDESLGAWRSTWIGPYHSLVRTFIARPVGDEIVLAGTFDGLETRWVFSDITRRSFRWRNEHTADGERWHLNQTFEARRRAV